MKVYIDTTVLIALLFGDLSDRDADRHDSAVEFFATVNSTPDITAFISLYGLQELTVFVYDNYPADSAGTVLRLAVLTLFRNEVVLVPLLDRVETLRYRRRATMPDRSDQPHLNVAMKYECDHVLTYDEHFARVSAVTAVTPEEFTGLLKRSV